MDQETRWVLDEWETALNDLSRDYWACKDRIDWVAKKFLLDTMREAEQLSWSDPWLQSIDLEYHNISLEKGLYYELVREGHIRHVVDEEAVKHAIFHPPETTRAFFRGRAVAKFNREITSIQWDELVFASNGTSRLVELLHPALDADLDHKNAAIRGAQTFEELLKGLS
jgi:proteasome accessory factor A